MRKPLTLKARLAKQPLPARRTDQVVCRLTAREKATLIRYSAENDLSESQTLRRALVNLFKETYPDFT